MYVWICGDDGVDWKTLLAAFVGVVLLVVAVIVVAFVLVVVAAAVPACRDTRARREARCESVVRR